MHWPGWSRTSPTLTTSSQVAWLAAPGKEAIKHYMPLPPTRDALKTNAVVPLAAKEPIYALARLERDLTYTDDIVTCWCESAPGKETNKHYIPMSPTGDALRTNAVVPLTAKEVILSLNRLEQDFTYVDGIVTG